MRVGIMLSGPNASGKTTILTKVSEMWKGRIWDDPNKLKVFYADNNDLFKGSAESQEAALTKEWLDETPVIIFEGTRINTPLLRVAKKYRDWRKYEVIMCTQTSEVMKAHLEARCAKRGKTFRADYWDCKKLEYEGNGRYPNIFRKNSVATKTFSIDLEYRVCEEIANYISGRVSELLESCPHGNTIPNADCGCGC